MGEPTARLRKDLHLPARILRLRMDRCRILALPLRDSILWRRSDFPSVILCCGLLVFACLPSLAECAPAAISWEALCAASVCRATGHDGASAVEFSPDGRHLVVAASGPDQSGLYLVERDGSARFWIRGSFSRPGWRAATALWFVRDNDLWTIEIGQRKPRATDQRQRLMCAHLRPSPTGDQVVFASSRPGHQGSVACCRSMEVPRPNTLTQGAMPVDEARFRSQLVTRRVQRWPTIRTAPIIYWSDDHLAGGGQQQGGSTNSRKP